MGEVIPMSTDPQMQALVERANKVMMRDMWFDRHYLKFGWDGVPDKDAEFLRGTIIHNWLDVRKREGMVIFGAIGVGKTTGVCLTVRELVINALKWVDDAPKDRFRSMPNYMFARCTSLINSLCSDTADDRSLANNCKSAKLVVIDDLGSDGQLPAWRKARFEDFVTERWSNDLPTFVTTNLADERAIGEMYGNAVADRLVDSNCNWVHRWSTNVSQRSGQQKFREI